MRLFQHWSVLLHVSAMYAAGVAAGCGDGSRPKTPEPGAAGQSGGGQAGDSSSSGGTSGLSEPSGGAAGTPRGSSGGGGISAAGSPASGGSSFAGDGPTSEGGAGGSGGTAGAAGQSTGGANTMPGGVCTGNAQCSATDHCIRMPGTADATCRPRCSLTAVGTSDGCDAGSICSLDANGARAACARRCDPFGDELPPCPEMDGCYAAPDPSLTAGNEVPGLCVRAGILSPGEACNVGDCIDGLECLATDDGDGVAYCSPPCDPAAAAGEAGACPLEQSCEVGTSGRAGCVTRCTPGTGEECTGAEYCHPLAGPIGDGEPAGRCIIPGTLALGEPCEPGECERGLSCTELPTPLVSTERRCAEMCFPASGGACSSGTCFPAGRRDSEVGTCHEPCVPLEVGLAAGCAEEEWCAPSSSVAGVGLCTAQAGPRGAGETCGTQSECGAGTYCECRFGSDTSCLTTATCEPICISGASGDAPGACPSDEVCAVESGSGLRYPFGICRAACDIEGTPGCPQGETCIAAVLAGSDRDACSDVPTPLVTLDEPCPAPEFNIGDVCGPLDLCVQWESLELPRCSAICRFELGAEGSTAHPDCAVTEAICAPIPGELDFGYCRSIP